MDENLYAAHIVEKIKYKIVFLCQAICDDRFEYLIMPILTNFLANP